MGAYAQKIKKAQSQQDYNYELISEFDYKYWILTLAINNNNKLLVAGVGNVIQFCQIQREHLKQIAVANTGQVVILKCLKQKPLFISGIFDASLIIWSFKTFSNRKFIFKLKNHTLSISCIVIHPENEDIIVTGSNDCTIKFWVISQQQWLCQQTINNHRKSVNSIAFNFDGNKLISCSNDKRILIIEGSIDQKWYVKQTIKMPQYGFRMTFITNEMFAFQPNSYNNGRNLTIFKLDSSNKQFQLLHEIPILGRDHYCYQGFPSTYIQSKNLLIIKNCNYVNIIRILPSEPVFTLIQSINFETGYLFGNQSDDGDLLVTWDISSAQIQIRKLILNV